MCVEKSVTHVQCLGLSHLTSSVALRERLAFTPHQLHVALARLGCGSDPAWNSLNELVILSTCNRVELYAVAERPIFSTLETFLSETQNCPRSEFSGSLYFLADGEAIRHLMEVACGLDSLVLGEPQILGQVTDAYSAARKHATAGKILSKIFQAAIHTGKRARSETAISHNPASIASVAVKLISRTVSDLAHARIMVLGAGEMAELAVEALRKRGSKDILVVNRTLNKAQELADRWNGKAAALEMLPEYLADMDIVITSTSAPHVIVQRSVVEKAMEHRPERPLVIVDIAVPRDVDSDVEILSGVYLYDMDALSNQLETSLARREAEVPRVEAIVTEELADIEKCLASLDVVPIIVELRDRADNIRQNEVRKAVRRMPDLTPEMEDQIELLTKSIVNKILHNPTARLREGTSGPEAADYARFARSLFGLE